MRLRYEGPMLKDMPMSEGLYTVIDPYSPYFKYTNAKATLIRYGFSEAEMNEAKAVRGGK